MSDDKDRHAEVEGEGEAAKGHHDHEEHKKKKKKEEGDELKAALEEKDKQIEELKGKFLYQQADFENFKKLKAREKQEALRFGNEQLIKDLLPVIDNLERAVEHAAKTEETKAITEGVTLTLNGFLKVLAKFDVTRIEATGNKFDPNFHEAVYQEESGSAEAGTVIAELQKGYVMGGRLLRPSMVSVAKKPQTE
jgi:molecular chaperone GrpE